MIGLVLSIAVAVQLIRTAASSVEQPVAQPFLFAVTVLVVGLIVGRGAIQAVGTAAVGVQVGGVIAVLVAIFGKQHFVAAAGFVVVALSGWIVQVVQSHRMRVRQLRAIF